MPPREQVESAFKTLDENGKGVLSVSLFNHLLTTLNDPLDADNEVQYSLHHLHAVAVLRCLRALLQIIRPKPRSDAACHVVVPTTPRARVGTKTEASTAGVVIIFIVE